MLLTIFMIDIVTSLVIGIISLSRTLGIDVPLIHSRALLVLCICITALLPGIYGFIYLLNNKITIVENTIRVTDILRKTKLYHFSELTQIKLVQNAYYKKLYCYANKEIIFVSSSMSGPDFYQFIEECKERKIPILNNNQEI